MGLLGVRVNKIACGQEHVLAMSEDKEVFSWGSNANSQLGINKSLTHKVVEFSSFTYEMPTNQPTNRSGDTQLDPDGAIKLEEDYDGDSIIEKKKAITTTKKAICNYKGVPHKLTNIQGRIENVSCGDLNSFAIVKL